MGLRFEELQFTQDPSNFPRRNGKPRSRTRYLPLFLVRHPGNDQIGKILFQLPKSPISYFSVRPLHQFRLKGGTFR